MERNITQVEIDHIDVEKNNLVLARANSYFARKLLCSSDENKALACLNRAMARLFDVDTYFPALPLEADKIRSAEESFYLNEIYKIFKGYSTTRTAKVEDIAEYVVLVDKLILSRSKLLKESNKSFSIEMDNF